MSKRTDFSRYWGKWVLMKLFQIVHDKVSVRGKWNNFDMFDQQKLTIAYIGNKIHFKTDNGQVLSAGIYIDKLCVVDYIKGMNGRSRFEEPQKTNLRRHKHEE